MAGLRVGGSSLGAVYRAVTLVRVLFLSLAGVGAIGLAACGSATKSSSPGRNGVKAASLQAGSWLVRVTVTPSRVGPFRVTIENLIAANPAPSNPWISHAVAFHNTGGRAATFDSSPGIAFLGDHGRRRLLVGDDGCGYVQGDPKRPVRDLACFTALQAPIRIERRASGRVSITLWKGLHGMAPLVAGTYAFRQTISVGTGPPPLPRVITLSYRVEPSVK